MKKKGVKVNLYNNQQMSEAKKIVGKKLFREADFHSNQDKMAKMFKAVNEMEVGTDLFKCIRILIKFFRFPALPLFRNVYSRIEKNKAKYLMQNHSEIIKTAAYAKAIIKNRNFPSLAFYFKAGCDSQVPKDLEAQEHNKHFIVLVEEIDALISTSGSPVLSQEKKQLDNIELKLLDACKQNALVIEKLCLNFYLNMLRERKQDVEKQLSLQKPTISFHKPKSDTVRFETTKGFIKEINDPLAGSDYLCCRSYFYLNEIIEQPETIIQQYKNYQYPYNTYLANKLTKTICGFLNSRGGIIYVGVYQNVDTKKRLVKGDRYSESVKENLLTYFRLMCQKIYPQIVNCQMYKIEFVPIKDGNTNGWIPGMFLLRIKVQKGSPLELYSYKNQPQELFAFRTENQVLSKRIGQQILEIYRQKLLNTNSQSTQDYLNHPGPCRPVQMGKQIFEYEDSSRSIPLPWNNNRKSKYGYVQKGQSRAEYKTNLPRDIQRYKKPLIIWKRCPQLSKFELQTQKTKSEWLLMDVHDLKSFQKIQDILISQNLLDKVSIISLLARVNNDPDRRNVYRELENSKILFTTYGQDLFQFHNIDEAIVAMEILNKLGANYSFEIQSQE